MKDQGLWGRFAWTAVDAVASVLERDEQDAVRGDLIESKATPARALREVVGLAMRRQFALWTTWGPWLALLAVAIPMGVLLSHVTRWFADTHATYAYLYVNNWTWSYIESRGARIELLKHIAHASIAGLAVVGWSWSSGYALGSLSRKTVWITGCVLGLLVLTGTIGTTTAARAIPPDTVFSLPFYRTAFPRVWQISLALLPAAWGLIRGLGPGPLSLRWAISTAIAIVVLTAWTAPSVEAAVLFGRNAFPPHPGFDNLWGTADDPRPLRLLPLVMIVPVMCLLARSVATTLWPHPASMNRNAPGL